jgi:transcriptional regulator with XRE-family HTH domain
MATPRFNSDGTPRKRVKASALTEKGISKMSDTIKTKRMGLGMTQAEFTEWILKEGRRLGLPGTEFSGGAVQNWELKNIASCPDLGNMRLLAAVFGLDTDSFVNYLNGDWPTIQDFLKDPINQKKDCVKNPNLVPELFQEADTQVKAKLVIKEVESLYSKLDELQKMIKEIDLEDVKAFLCSAPKDLQKEVYQYLQEKLIGA